MFVERLVLRNFKRFTDLTIDLSERHSNPPRLVLLIGANGSGKSSVFDAFSHLASRFKPAAHEHRDREGCLPKSAEKPLRIDALFGDGRSLTASGQEVSANPPDSWPISDVFYGRSAYRTVAEIPVDLGAMSNGLAGDQDRPHYSIHPDTRLLRDVAHVTGRILKEVFESGDFNSKELRARFLHPINRALERVFPRAESTQLRLHRLIPPLEGRPAEIRFRKGESDIHYDLLSAERRKCSTSF